MKTTIFRLMQKWSFFIKPSIVKPGDVLFSHYYNERFLTDALKSIGVL
jgi:hypothetical protein